MKIKANLFKELSNKNTPIEIEAGQEVGRAFGEIDTENAVFLVNGKEVKPDYILQPADVVTVRVLPSSMTTVAIVAVAVIAVGAAVIGGIALYKAKKAREEANEEIEKIKKLSNSPTVDNRPFLRGATNTLAIGNSQAYLMGRNLFTPYLHCTPFYHLGGEDGAAQWVYHSVECGFNSQVFSSLSIDDIVIKSFSDTTPQQGFDWLDFTKQPFATGGFEISQNGEDLKSIPELNFKCVSKHHNAEIKRDETVGGDYWDYFLTKLPLNAADLEIAITFPAGLWAYNDSNDRVATSCTITPQYSLDGGKTWKDFTFNNNGTMTNTFTRNEDSKELRFAARHTFTLSEYKELHDSGESQILARVRSNGKDDSRINNACYVLYTQSFILDPNKSSKPAGLLDDGGAAGIVWCKNVEDRERKFCTVMGLAIEATNNNEDKLKKINFVSTSVARIWDGTKWSTDKRPTRNLAALLLELLTSYTHPASRIDDTELDLESFGEAFEWCENNGYMYDAVITSGMKKRDIVAQMLTACGGVLYRDILGRYALAIDKPQENALAVFNAQNIISITNKKGFQRRTDGLRLHYINSKNDLYKEDTYLLMREVNGRPLPITPDSIIKDVTLQGVTTYNHVVKYARRLMAIEALRPKVTTIEIGNEGIFYTPLSKVLIQDDSLKIGLSNGVIKSAVYVGDNLSRLIIDGFVDFENSKRYGVIINGYDENGGVIYKLEVRGTGRTNELGVVTPAPVIVDGGFTFSFGELEADGSFDKVATPYIIQSIARSGSRFILDLVNYNEAIFNVGTIPDYVSNITERPTPAPALPIFRKDGKDGKDGKQGMSGLTPFIEKSAIVYNANASGVVVESVIRDKIRLEQEGVAIPFTIGKIDAPAGFEITSEGDTVIIKALAGADMALNGVIKIPINYSAVEIIRYKDQEKNIYIDSNGDAYADIKTIGEALQFNFYVSYAKSPQGEKGANGKDGKDGKDGANGKDGTRAPKYWGKRTSAPTQDGVVIGDYYLDIDTVRLYRCYGISAENVASWESLTPDEAPDLYFLQINEVMSLISKLPANDPVKLFVNNYVQLLLVDTEFVKYLGAKKIRILENGVIIGGDRYEDDGDIKDYSKDGFYLQANGISKMRLLGDRENILLGEEAGQNLQKTIDTNAGKHNNCIGYKAGSSITTSNYNNCIGCNAGKSITTGAINNCIGWNAGNSITTGSDNNCIGYRAGDSITRGSNNTCIGYRAGYSITTGIGNICIGPSTQVPNPAGDNQINIGNVFKYDGTSADVPTLIAPATIIANASATAPKGWLQCNGQAVSRATYSRLFTAIGTKYGAGDGNRTFNVPNLTDRFVMGAGNKAWGAYVGAGLPNITGEINNNFYPLFPLESTGNGCFELTERSGINTWTSVQQLYLCNNFKFNASKSNSIYGNSITVQPPAIAMYFYIKY